MIRTVVLAVATGVVAAPAPAETGPREILKAREEIKKQTIRQRRLQHQSVAA